MKKPINITKIYADERQLWTTICNRHELLRHAVTKMIEGQLLKPQEFLLVIGVLNFVIAKIAITDYEDTELKGGLK